MFEITFEISLCKTVLLDWKNYKKYCLYSETTFQIPLFLMRKVPEQTVVTNMVCVFVAWSIDQSFKKTLHMLLTVSLF